MKIRIEKGTARGKITAPPSKSMAHRLLIAAAMSEGVSTVRGISSCEDVLATLDCLSTLGIRVTRSGNDVTVEGRDFRKTKPTSPMQCRESGSTLRFMIPAAMLSGHTAVFCGAKRLMQRPMGIYEQLFAEKGLYYSASGENITVKGPLVGGEYRLVGNVSSQFISGLIFALPLAESDSYIKIAPPIESRSYIELTLNAVKLFGIQVDWIDDCTLKILGGQSYRACDVTVEGDYSGAAFPDALNLFGSEVKIAGLDPESLQGDKVYSDCFALLSQGAPTIDIEDCPDLGPILFAVAAAKRGGKFNGTKRLKIKESDRAAAMAEELRKFGTKIIIHENSVEIIPEKLHAPSSPVFGHNDHRIVMSLAVLLTLVGGEIDGAEAISKSYPEFFKDLGALGIGVYEV